LRFKRRLILTPNFKFENLAQLHPITPNLRLLIAIFVPEIISCEIRITLNTIAMTNLIVIKLSSRFFLIKF